MLVFVVCVCVCVCVCVLIVNFSSQFFEISPTVNKMFKTMTFLIQMIIYKPVNVEILLANTILNYIFRITVTFLGRFCIYL